MCCRWHCYVCMLHTHSNTDGDKLVIFSTIALYYGDTLLYYHSRILCYHLQPAPKQKGFSYNYVWYMTLHMLCLWRILKLYVTLRHYLHSELYRRSFMWSSTFFTLSFNVVSSVCMSGKVKKPAAAGIYDKAGWFSEPFMNSLVPGTLCWWVGIGSNWSIADCISGCRKAINIGQKKEPLGLKYTQLICSHTSAHYQKITCVYKHLMKISTHSGY